MKLTTLSLLILVAVPTTSASATTRTCRPLVVDPTGDARDWAVPGDAYHPELDITGLRMTTAAGGLEASVSVVDLTSTMPSGSYAVFFTLGSYSYNAFAQHQIDGDSFAIQSSPTESGVALDEVASVTGSIDNHAGVIRWSLPWAVLHGAHRGMKAYSVQAGSNTSYGTTKASAGNTIDATDQASYRIGATRCS